MCTDRDRPRSSSIACHVRHRLQRCCCRPGHGWSPPSFDRGSGKGRQGWGRRGLPDHLEQVVLAESDGDGVTLLIEVRLGPAIGAGAPPASCSRSCRCRSSLPTYSLSKMQRWPMPPLIAASQAFCTPPSVTGSRAMNSGVHEVVSRAGCAHFTSCLRYPVFEGELHAHDYRVEAVVECRELDERAWCVTSCAREGPG